MSEPTAAPTGLSGWYDRGYITGQFRSPAPPADVLTGLMYEDREGLLDFVLGLIDGADLGAPSPADNERLPMPTCCSVWELDCPVHGNRNPQL